jgi:hypothetical protein
MHKTIVELDLVGFSTICDIYEQGLAVGSVAQLNEQIQSFIDAGLKAVNAPRDQTVMATTGDGAILVFDSAQDAHRFAEAVHATTRDHNRTRTQPSAKRVFRSGAATGDIVMQPKPGGGFDIAGTTIVRAVRLEAKAQPGSLLVDEKTYENLSSDQRQRYGAKKPVPGKRDEVFQAHECLFDAEGPRDASFFTHQAGKEPPPGIATDIFRIIKYVPAKLIGRETETALLNDAWAKARNLEPNRPHVLTFVALGGEGKTSLVTNWVVKEMLDKGWPGCTHAFAWSFYDQGAEEQPADSSDLFLKAALNFFGDAETAASPQHVSEKGRRLAQLVGGRQALLILDGLEPLQYAPTSPTPGELKDQGIAALLKGLAGDSHGLCLVTTRYSLPDLKAFWQTSAREVKLLRLSRDAGVDLLKTLLVTGPAKEFEALVEDVKGHALTLTLLGSYLRDCHAGDIRQRDLVKLEEANAEELGGHAFRVMDAYVQALENGGKTEEDKAKGRRALALLDLLGLFDRPATADCLDALWKGDAIAGLTEPLLGLTEAQRNGSLTRLENAKLLTVNRDAAHRIVSLDAHPLLREYFAQRVRRRQPRAWRAAHKRLYQYLCSTTPDKPQPELEDLQPLYQAVAHGCQAGLHQEVFDGVYRRRIRHGEVDYSWMVLGAFGSDICALACFFETPWSLVSPLMKGDRRSQLMFDAGTALRALGRGIDALELTRVGLEENVMTKNWCGASWGACNLSELKLTAGMIADARQLAQRSVTYAERTSIVRRKVISRTLLADALHQEGNRHEAARRFSEAEALLNERGLDFPPLYALWRHPYYDFLLAAPERAAWRYILQFPSKPNPSTALEACRTVAVRATQELNRLIAGGCSMWLLTIGLTNLTVGNASLYEVVLGSGTLDPCRLSLQNAVEVLRRAGDSAHLPRSLLARALLRALEGARTGSESARSDLNEAWEIAERGPMPLFLADIHLHRARLFFPEHPYPWISPQADLVVARQLIERCGYWRRKEELEDAEKVIGR